MCRMRKTINVSDAEDLERVDMGKRARVLVEGVKGLEGSTELLEGLKSEGGVCNGWIINKGWARFLYIVYI